MRTAGDGVRETVDAVFLSADIARAPGRERQHYFSDFFFDSFAIFLCAANGLVWGCSFEGGRGGKEEGDEGTGRRAAV